MYMMRKLIIPLILILTLLTGCSDDEGGIKTMADLNVVIVSGETYQFAVTTGNEEDASIVKHPTKKCEISEYRKDTTTTNGIYTYKPASDFIGTDEVEIEKRTYTFDTEPQVNKARIKIRITVEKGFPDNLSN